jgi:hypothetical protein
MIIVNITVINKLKDLRLLKSISYSSNSFIIIHCNIMIGYELHFLQTMFYLCAFTDVKLKLKHKYR